jgi:hypothetical protein
MEVHLNAEKLCTAGIGAHAVLGTIIDVVARKGDYDMMLRVGGLRK